SSRLAPWRAWWIVPAPKSRPGRWWRPMTSASPGSRSCGRSTRRWKRPSPNSRRGRWPFIYGLNGRRHGRPVATILGSTSTTSFLRYAMREVVIVDSVRTGLAKSFRGKFNMTRPDDMAAHCVNALLTRNDLDPALVDDCIVGAASNEGAQGYNIGRNVAVLSRLGIDCPGMTLNRYCSSGLQAIAMAANQIASGCSDVIVAGGVESISLTLNSKNTDYLFNPIIQAQVPGIYHSMGQTAERV